jgi:hypothetical protein
MLAFPSFSSLEPSQPQALDGTPRSPSFLPVLEEVNMNDETTVPAAVPVLPQKPTDRKVMMLLGIGATIGLAVGILLTMGAYTTYYWVTETLPSTRDQVLVFNELNELRQQINELNEAKKTKEKESEEALQKALNTVASKIPGTDSKAPDAGQSAKSQKKRVPGVDPFADIDAEIEDLQHTQKVLNTVLDLFTAKKKEQAAGSTAGNQ